MAAKVHATAVVHPDAELGDDVEIGPFTIIHSNVQIGNRVAIGSFCEIGVSTPLAHGDRLEIGSDSIIRSHSVFYESSKFGDRLMTGHRVTVRENTLAGINLQIGTLCDLQGDLTIGDYVRFHSNVHVGKASQIGNFVWIFPYVVLTNDPTPPSETLDGVIIEDFAVIATMAVLLPGVRVGAHALVAAGACVGRDVPNSSIVAGVPGKILGATSKIKRRGMDIAAYPWPTHFRRGYPKEVLDQWSVDFGD